MVSAKFSNQKFFSGKENITTTVYLKVEYAHNAHLQQKELTSGMEAYLK